LGQAHPIGQLRCHEAFGTGAKIRRRERADRPSLIVVDDPENDGHVTSTVHANAPGRGSTGRGHAGTMHDQFLVLGAALHRIALCWRLTRTAGWQGRTFRD